MNDTYDRTLARLHQSAPEYERWGLDGLSNHAPMVAEAYVALDLPLEVESFLARFATHLRPMTPARALASDERRAALGDVSQVARWIATYEEELAARPWDDVLREAIDELAPGVIASALHGWLRVAHAVRALGRQDTAVRRRELAHGLGLLAARFQTLPGRPGARADGLDAERLLGAVPRVPSNGQGLIFDAVRAVDDEPRFADLVERWDPATFELDSFVRAATRFGARRVIGAPKGRIAFIHAVTAASALRLVAPLLDAPRVRRVGGFLLQAIAALEAVYGAHFDEAPAAPPPMPTPTPAELRAGAARSQDEHAVKLIEAALREHALGPADELLRAAGVLVADG